MTAPRLRAVNPDSPPADLLGLSTNSRGEPHATTDNVFKVLSGCSEWSGVFRLSTLDAEIKIAREPPFDPDTHNGKAGRLPRALSENDHIKTQSWLDRRFNLRVGKESIYDAIAVIAERDSFHPINDYLMQPVWDEAPRLENWLTTYLGVEAGPMARLAGPWWLVQAVKRVVEPGCKADYVLVLEGTQGAYKSTLLESLCPDSAWFQDSHIDLSGNKEGPIGLRGKWICEFGELASLRRSTVESTKAFLTRKVDRYRPPYGRLPIDVPRQCVFAATTNEQEYLIDPTGGRRFWPVKVGAIDLDALCRDRDQIWAEAFHWYREAVRHWPTREEQDAIFTPEQTKRAEVEPWIEKIAAWLAKNPVYRRDGITNTEVCELCLELKASNTQKKGADGPYRTVARCMKALGWSRNRSTGRYFPAGSQQDLDGTDGGGE